MASLRPSAASCSLKPCSVTWVFVTHRYSDIDLPSTLSRGRRCPVRPAEAIALWTAEHNGKRRPPQRNIAQPNSDYTPRRQNYNALQCGVVAELASMGSGTPPAAARAPRATRSSLGRGIGTTTLRAALRAVLGSGPIRRPASQAAAPPQKRCDQSGRQIMRSTSRHSQGRWSAGGSVPSQFPRMVLRRLTRYQERLAASLRDGASATLDTGEPTQRPAGCEGTGESTASSDHERRCMHCRSPVHLTWSLYLRCRDAARVSAV